MTEQPHHLFVPRDHPELEALVPVDGIDLAETREVGGLVGDVRVPKVMPNFASWG